MQSFPERHTMGRPIVFSRCHFAAFLSNFGQMPLRVLSFWGAVGYFHSVCSGWLQSLACIVLFHVACFLSVFLTTTFCCGYITKTWYCHLGQLCLVMDDSEISILDSIRLDFLKKISISNCERFLPSISRLVHDLAQSVAAATINVANLM